MNYSIKVFNDPERLPELVALFRTGLGDTTADYWKWRLFSDNGQADKPTAIVAEDESGKMVAVSSVLPALYGQGEATRKCLQPCDWVVHPDYRGQGLIGMLYRYTCSYYAEKGYDFMIAYPNDNSYPILLKYGFIEEPHIVCWNTKKHWIVRGVQPKDITVNQTQIKFTDVCPLRDEVFVSEDRIVRDSTFLRWKYDQNPDTKYHWVTFWSEGRCVGYMVYTLTRGRFRTAVNVYDWTYCDNDGKAFAEAIQKIAKLGNWVSIWGRYSEQTQGLLKQAGLSNGGGLTRLVLKALSPKGWPDPLTLTRIDTDY